MEKKTSLQKVAEKLANDARPYAKRYNCSLCSAIADRDYPVSEAEVVATLTILGIEASTENIAACRPDTLEYVEEFVHEQRVAYDPRPGEPGYCY
jgi:hypothetical protein